MERDSNLLRASESPILEAHCLVPPRHRFAYRCARLRNQLFKLTRAHRVVLVCSPPGYGKTTLASQFVASTGRPAGWLTLDDYHNNPALFVASLQVAISFLLATPSRPAESLGTSISLKLTGLLNSLALSRSAEQTQAPFYFVLDGAHLLVDAEAREIMSRFIEYAPDNMRLLVLARSQPSLGNLPRLRAAGDLASLTAADLSLTPEEVAAFLDHCQCGRSDQCPPESVSELEGWITGLQLLASSLDDPPTDDRPSFAGSGPTVDGPQLRPSSSGPSSSAFNQSARQHIADYLSLEVFDRLPQDLQRFMVRTSVLDELDIAACQAIGVREARHNLQRLRSGDHYVVSNGEGVLRYRAFFRAFLRDRLALEDQATVYDLHRRATGHYISQELYAQAIEHHISSGEYRQGADLIGKLHDDFLTGEYAPQLQRWLMRFPRELRSTHPWLLLSQARAEVGSTDLAATEQLYKQAASRARHDEDHSAVIRALCSFGQWLRARGRYSEALVAYDEAAPFCGDDQEKAVVTAAAALCAYLEHGRADAALLAMKNAVDLAHSSDRTTTVKAVLELHAELLYLLGDLKGAMAGYATVLKLEERSRERLDPAVTKNEGIATARRCAYLHALRGEWSEAANLLALAPEETAELAIAEPAALTSGRAAALAQFEHISGMVAHGTWRSTPAWKHYNRALDFYERCEDRWHMAAVLGSMCDLACAEGDAGEALKRAEKGLSLRHRTGTPYEQATCKVPLGRALALAGRSADALRVWTSALEVFTTCGAVYHQAQLHIYLAWFYQRTIGPEPAKDGQPPVVGPQSTVSCLSHLHSALDLCKEREYDCLLTGNPEWTIPLLALAIEEGVHGTYATEILRRAGARGTPDALRALQTLKSQTSHSNYTAPSTALEARQKKPRQSPNLRHAAQLAIGAWLEADPEPLQVCTLGLFSLQRGERPIENWPRQSSRILFQYLLLHRARPVPVDELIEVLWPHKQLAPSRKNLHQVVTGLRHVLEPELPAGVPSRYLRVAGGRYQLALPPGSSVDDELFLDICKRAGTLRERERAAALYTGDYLPDTLYHEWTTAHRERLSDCYRSLLLRLASDYLEVGRFDECIAAARYMHDQEPWSENAAYLLMSAYAARGERASALRAYDALQRCLREEFEIAPRPDIVGYYQQILHQ